MKALKVIGILVLAVVGLGLIASLVLPKDMVVEESVVVSAPMDVVWKNVSNWENVNKWSPWYRADPDMKVTYEGESGTVDSKYTWSGNDKVGYGHQIFTSIDAENHATESEVYFFKPWEGMGNAGVNLSDEGDGNTKVTWTYKQHTGVPGNLFGALFNAKGMLSEGYTFGLSKLKEITEEEFRNMPVEVSYAVNSEMREARKYAGNRELVEWDSMHSYFQANMPKIAMAFGEAKMEMGSAPSALYFKWNEETKDAELTVAIGLKGKTAPKGYKTYEVPGGEYLVIDYYGDYDGSGAAHEAMYAHISENGYTIPEDGIVIEEYITDPGTEPDKSKWLTKIVYPVTKTTAGTEDL